MYGKARDSHVHYVNDLPNDGKKIFVMLSSFIQHSMNELEMQIFHSNYLLS